MAGTGSTDQQQGTGPVTQLRSGPVPVPKTSPVRESHLPSTVARVNTRGVPNTGPRYSGRSELTQIVGRARLFLSSYAPLFGILAISFDGLALRLVCLGLFATGMADTWHITRLAKTETQDYEITVQSSEDTGAEVSGYLASYLLPFVTVASPGWRELLAYSLFLLVAFVIYVRSNLVRVNPTLYLFGYRVLKIVYGEGEQDSFRHAGPAAKSTLLRSLRALEHPNLIFSVIRHHVRQNANWRSLGQ